MFRVEMIFAIVIRLRCVAEQNLDKLDARESADAADPSAAAEAAKAEDAAAAENGGGPPKIACLRGNRCVAMGCLSFKDFAVRWLLFLFKGGDLRIPLRV